MDPNLIIIKFIFKKNGIINTDESIDAFFQNGISFPFLIKFLYGDNFFDTSINKDPKTENEKEQNNKTSLIFLNERLYSDYSMENEKERTELINSVLNLKFFDTNELMRKCNIILKPLNVRIEKETDLQDIKCLIYLLNVLSDGLISKDITKFYDPLLINAFEIAKVPLVINKQSLQENEGKFYIQIEIILDVFSEKVQEILSSNIQIDQENLSNYHHYDSVLIQSAIEKTVNAIAQKKNNEFEIDFNFSWKLDNKIPEFVMMFFDISYIEDVYINDDFKIESTKENSRKNKMAVIEFLKKKDEIFNVLSFDFSSVNSIYSFFRVFLNTFFIKDSKMKMYERAENLLCTKKFENDFFHDYKRFKYLLNFVIKGNFHLDSDDADLLFESANIPHIINEKLLFFDKNDEDSSMSTFQNSDFVFYQLKFIFDALDSGPKSRLIVERFMIAIKKLQQVKILRFDILVSSIKAKQASFNLQKMNFQKFNKKIVENSTSKRGDDNDANKVIQIPKSFKDRHKLQFFDDEEKEEEFLGKKATIFWNSSSFHYNYENGILYDKKISEKEQKEWKKQIKLSNKTSKLKVVSEESRKAHQSLSFKSSSNNFEAKLYKLFYYDENDEIWMFDSSAFEKFSKEKRINIGNSRTPVVLFLESYEDDLISINCNLINGLYPKLDDDNIFVYAFCDRALSMLNYTVDFINREKASIKPLFLLVHVPEEKRNLHNIDSILIHIYSFLSLISDLEIVVLNKNHFVEQIKFIETIISITKHAFDKSKQNSGNKLQINSPLLISNNSTKDFYLDEKEKPLIVKDSKIIFLINDEKVDINQTPQINENIMKFKKETEKEIKFHFINVNNLNTYEHFLNSLNDILLLSTTIFTEVWYNFTVIIPKFCNIYIDLKKNHESDLIRELKTIILNRYSILTKIDCLKPIYYIWNEIYTFFPAYETDLFKKCNSILEDLKLKVCQNSRTYCISEITKSSELNLAYINELINSKLYWTMEQLELIKENHFQFLNEEYFDIVHARFYEDDFDVFFENNCDIVENLIKEDDQKISEIFKIYIEKIEVKKKEKEIDVNEEILKGANYAMKESENLREIKVAVEVGSDLKSEIEQDF